MMTNVQATVFLSDDAGEKVEVRRVKDERQYRTARFHYSVKLGDDVTLFVEPESMGHLIKALQAGRKSKRFDGILADK